MADSGIENATIMVRTSSGQYVLRVYRQNKKTDEDIQHELGFVSYLGENGIPVAPPLANLKGRLISHLVQNGYAWQAILMCHMPGSHSDHYPSELITNLAATQAQMHILASSYRTSETGKELTQLRESHFIKLIKDRGKLGPRLQGFIARAESYVVNLDGSLPKGLCHLDFDNGNVLSQNNAVTAVLDFDDLIVAPYVVCLAYTLRDVVHDHGLEGLKLYIETYDKIRRLTDKENNLIKPIMLFRHYVICCVVMAHKQISESKLNEYLKLESELLSLSTIE